MNTQIVITEFHLRAAMRHLLRDPAHPLVCPAGLNRLDNETEWLVRGVGVPANLEARQPYVILTAQSLPVQPDAIRLGNRMVAVVHLPREGAPAVQFLIPDGGAEAGNLRIMGAGLLEFATPDRRLPPASSPDGNARWSRVRGALGSQAWTRLRSLRCAIVGCGRTGSIVAHSLARMGVHNLALIDPDIVELHNLDGEGFQPNDVGSPKAEALAKTLLSIDSELRIAACTHSITAIQALTALKKADVLLCCADNDGARWACGLIASLYLKPMLDIGVAVFSGTMGADVRWIVPGESCLGCMGGVANVEHVEATFRSRWDEEQFQVRRDWQRERAGSLRSLNLIAAGLGLRMVEDYLTGRLRRRQWLRLVYADGAPSIQVLTAPVCAGHSLCALCGAGDEGLLTQSQTVM